MTEAREFLMPSRPFLKNLSPKNLINFVKNFSNINPLLWDEVERLTKGKQTLMEEVFPGVSRLPLPYILQNAPTSIQKAVLYIQSLDKSIDKDILSQICQNNNNNNNNKR